MVKNPPDNAGDIRDEASIPELGRAPGEGHGSPLQYSCLEINPEYSLEGLMLKLKCQYFGHLMERANSLGKTLMLRKTEAKGEEGGRG